MPKSLWLQGGQVLVSLNPLSLSLSPSPSPYRALVPHALNPSQDRRQKILEKMAAHKNFLISNSAMIAREIAQMPPGTFRGPVYGPILAEVSATRRCFFQPSPLPSLLPTVVL